MDSATVFSWFASRWRIAAIIGAGVAVACIYKRSAETEEQRAQRAKQKYENELTRVAKQISIYGRNLHNRYPDGEVVISDADLARHLRKPLEIVASALTLLCDQKRVQRAPLAGYWRLHF